MILHETWRGQRRVVACSAKAAVAGAVREMPLAEAVMLTAGSAALVPYDSAADRQALESLAEWCGQFSPSVGVEDSPAAECLLLDVTGLAHLFHGETALAEKVVCELAQRGLHARVALADTVGAAWAVAHYRVEEETRPGSRRARPTADGAGGSDVSAISSCTIVPPGEVLPALRRLPVEALRLSDDVVGLLHQLGIDRVAHIEDLPRNEISSRLGTELLRRWDQAVGRLAEPAPTHAAPPEFRAGWSPEGPTARRDVLEAALQHLIEQVAAKLAQAGRGAVRLQCRFDFVSSASAPIAPAEVSLGLCQPCFDVWHSRPRLCELSAQPRAAVLHEDRFIHQATAARAPGLFEPIAPVEISIGLFEPSAAAKHLFELVQMQMERLRFPGPVAAVEVVATATAALPVRQQEMFPGGDGSAREQWRRLAGLIDRLRSRLGRRAAASVRLVSDAQPEFAYRCHPLDALDKDHRRRRRGKTPAGELPPRPLRLLRRPAALSGVPNTSEVPPAAFSFAGRRHEVACTWGPERIETGWWRGRTIGRDYYRVETAAGHRYWLFRRLRDGRWFLHGIFE